MAFILTLLTPVQLYYTASENTGIQTPLHHHERRAPYLLAPSISGVCGNTAAPFVTPVLCKSDHLSSCSHGGNCHPPSVIDFESS